MEKTVRPGQPKTLMQAHEELVRIRPSRDAALVEWLRYYRLSVELYERIAVIDPGHNDDARYWAQRERHHAEEITAQIREERARR